MMVLVNLARKKMFGVLIELCACGLLFCELILSLALQCAARCVFAISTTWSTFFGLRDKTMSNRFPPSQKLCPGLALVSQQWWMPVLPKSSEQDGTNYSLPDVARDHHLHISTVTIMTSPGPMEGVGMRRYGALESLWQHKPEEHTDLTLTSDNQVFQRVLK